MAEKANELALPVVNVCTDASGQTDVDLNDILLR